MVAKRRVGISRGGVRTKVVGRRGKNRQVNEMTPVSALQPSMSEAKRTMASLQQHNDTVGDGEVGVPFGVVGYRMDLVGKKVWWEDILRMICFADNVRRCCSF